MAAATAVRVVHVPTGDLRHLSHIQAADLAVDFRLENIFDSDEGMARLLGAGLVHVDVNHESLCLMRLPYMSCLYVCLMRLPYMSGRRSDSY